MNRQIVLHEIVRDELERCRMMHEMLSLDTLPKGSLIERNGSYYRCVREDGRQFHVRIPPSDHTLLSDLKKRRFIKSELANFDHLIKTYEEFLENDVLYDPLKLVEELPEIYRDVPLDDFLLEGDINPLTWANAAYTRSNFRPEALVHETPGGLLVRSKSEAMIATRLEERGIPFRYEPLIELNGQIRCPDFEILLTNRRMLVYLEHLGMLDDPDYAVSAIEKISQYGENDIHVGINLFLTYETRKRPLTYKQVDRIIDTILSKDTYEW